MPEFTFKPDQPPPGVQSNTLRWIQNNLFSSPLNTLLTLIGAALLVLGVPPIIEWALLKATFTGSTQADCTKEGACWVFIQQNLMSFLYGFYPEDQRWRVNLLGLISLAGLIPLWLQHFQRKGLYALVFFASLPLFCLWLLYGGPGLSTVDTSLWGGLMLTLVITVVGMSGALPLGILLALGRRSELPILRAFCTAFIEIWRGVPLVTVLFMSSVMLPLFLPEGVAFDKLLRATLMIILFQAAYVAEVVRGGLQSIPKGQYEAAMALGLGYWRMMLLIILPQAIRLVIPGLVNTLIEFFKDTTLIMIIGLFDFLNSIRRALSNPAWLGMSSEGYVFAAVIYGILCFILSRYSMRLERAAHTGHRSEDNA